MQVLRQNKAAGHQGRVLTAFVSLPNHRLEGSNIEVFSLHPGVIQTPLGRHVGTAQGTWTGWLFGWLGAYWIKSTEQARTRPHTRIEQGVQDAPRVQKAEAEMAAIAW